MSKLLPLALLPFGVLSLGLLLSQRGCRPLGSVSSRTFHHLLSAGNKLLICILLPVNKLTVGNWAAGFWRLFGTIHRGYSSNTWKSHLQCLICESDDDLNPWCQSKAGKAKQLGFHKLYLVVEKELKPLMGHMFFFVIFPRFYDFISWFCQAKPNAASQTEQRRLFGDFSRNGQRSKDPQGKLLKFRVGRETPYPANTFRILKSAASSPGVSGLQDHSALLHLEYKWRETDCQTQADWDTSCICPSLQIFCHRGSFDVLTRESAVVFLNVIFLLSLV